MGAARAAAGAVEMKVGASVGTMGIADGVVALSEGADVDGRVTVEGVIGTGAGVGAVVAAAHAVSRKAQTAMPSSGL
jgi:hypothetical protein